MMHKSPIKELLPEPKPNKEPKDDATSICQTIAKPPVGSSAVGLLFDVQPIVTETCLNCEHRERHQCGGSIIQYCGVRKSNRTYNGQLKIKCKTPACSSFLKREKI
jgi:hypothetical protein